MWSTSAGGHLMKVVNLTGFTVLNNLSLGNQHTMCMRHIVFFGLPRSTKFFRIILWEAFGGGGDSWTQNVFFNSLYNVCLKHTSFGLHVKYPLFLSNFNKTWISSTVFRKILKQELLWKSVHWEPSCSMHTDRRADRHEANCRFSQFCERAKLVKKITDCNSKNQMTTKEQMEIWGNKWFQEANTEIGANSS